MAMNRRKFMQLAAGAGAGAAVTPGLSPFVPLAARAQEAWPKRVLVIYHGLGYLENSFWPTPGATPRDFTLGETQSVLDRFRDQLIYPDGLLLYGAQYFFPDDDNEHASGGNMTFTGCLKDGYATGPSFEQVIADHYWDPDSPATPFRDIALGVRAPTGPHHACFFRGNQQPVVPQENPRAAFDALFAGVMTEPDDSADRTREIAQRQSVLDYLGGRLRGVRARIGRQEEQILDAHLEHLRALELRVTASGPAPARCVVPDAPEGDWGGSGDQLANTIETHMDVIASAFSCDLARVATLQLGHCDGGLTPIEGYNCHDITHSIGDLRDNPTALAPAKARHREVDRWWADRWEYLLEKLSGMPDGDGDSLLDNTLIVWGTDTTTGESLQTGPHKHWRMPYFMAGGSNWAFETGRHLVYDHPDSVGRDVSEAWQANNRLWVSILQRYGIDVETFGNMDAGSGTLPML